MISGAEFVSTWCLMPDSLVLLFRLILDFISLRYVLNVEICFKLLKAKLVENMDIAIIGVPLDSLLST